MSFEFLDHTGDTAVLLTAPDSATLFREAARATLVLYLGTSARAAERRTRRDIHLEAEDKEALLVDFLNEIIYLFDTERFLVVDIAGAQVGCGPPASLKGVLVGDTLDSKRHTAVTEIKAATFHGLDIRREQTGLVAQVVYDL